MDVDRRPHDRPNAAARSQNRSQVDDVALELAPPWRARDGQLCVAVGGSVSTGCNSTSRLGRSAGGSVSGNHNVIANRQAKPAHIRHVKDAKFGASAGDAKPRRAEWEQSLGSV